MLHKKVLKISPIGVCLIAMNLTASAEGLYLPQHGLTLERQAQQQYIEKAAGDLFTGRNQKPFVLPDGWQRQDVTVSGIVVEKYTNTNSDSDKVLLQLHGGGYVLGMSDGHRLMALKQATLMDAKEAYCVNYRLAPDHVYPAALDDAIAAYDYLLNNGVKAENIVLVGDSAGGNLAVALTLYLRDHQKAMPRLLVLQSPWTDFSTATASRTYNDRKDKILGRGTPLNKAVKEPSYAGTLSLSDPRISLIHADLKGLPPMLIQTGGHEIFLTENQKFMEKAVDDGVEVTMTVYPDMPHDFALCLPDLDASVASLQEIGTFAKSHF